MIDGEMELNGLSNGVSVESDGCVESVSPILPDCIVQPATLEDMTYITSLANKESKAIGFIPKVAYEAAINGKKPSVNRWSDTCNDRIFMCYENGDPVGFVMMSYGQRAKVNQIVIQPDARLIERGKRLLTMAVDHGNDLGIHDFGCGCADDLDSNIFWQAMEWQKVGERKGIHFSNTYKESSDRKVNLYTFQTNSLFEIGTLHDDQDSTTRPQNDE